MTPSLREFLQEAIGELREAGVDSPELDAELLLAHALGVERSWLLAYPEHRLTPDQMAAFQSLLARRLAREPLAYITGRRWFYDIQLAVTPAVLIPRPETEELVERALAWLRERPRAVVADVGTGSGAIALAVAKHAPRARIYATDISPEALAVARENARRLGLAARVAFLLGDLLAPPTRAGGYHPGQPALHPPRRSLRTHARSGRVRAARGPVQRRTGPRAARTRPLRA